MRAGLQSRTRSLSLPEDREAQRREVVAELLEELTIRVRNGDWVTPRNVCFTEHIQNLDYRIMVRLTPMEVQP